MSSNRRIGEDNSISGANAAAAGRHYIRHAR
jgi:hypothetical protein